MSLLDRLLSPGPKRILALDGGGIRGAITLGYLIKIQTILRERTGKPDLRLCDYYDLIGGTSTGAIIASGLAIGMDAEAIKDLYLELGTDIFGQKRGLFQRLSAKFKIAPLEKQLERIFGDRTLGDPSIRTGLCIVTKRADTGSTWPLVNFPNAKYFGDNKDILLRKAVRASTAAPTYFRPEAFKVSATEEGAFVDGGVSMHNNPALQLFLIATLKGFRLNWAKGADKIMLTSIGTGYWPDRTSVDDVTDNKLWDWASEVISLLMNDAKVMNQLMLQFLSNSPTALKIDSEIGDLSDDLLTDQPLLHYLRYDALLTDEHLASLGFSGIRAEKLHEMSDAENCETLTAIGAQAAEREVAAGHFPEVFDQLSQTTV